MKKRAKIWIRVVTMIIVVISISIAPTIWRYSSYRKARLVIESGDEANAIRVITKLHNNPFFNLDWTVQGAVKEIPHGVMCYENVFGCPSCRGDFHTLLYHSARSGHATLTQLMIDCGASIERGGDKGERILKASVMSRNPSVVKLLIDEGADINAHNDVLGMPVIFLTTLSKDGVQEEIFNLLQKHGANIHLTNNNGLTILDWACAYSTNSIPFLIKCGALIGENRKPLSPDRAEALAQEIKKMHNQRVDLTR